MPTSDRYDLAPADSLFFPYEPRVEAGEVQGAVFPGFAQPCQHQLFVVFTDVAAFRGALAVLTGYVPSMREVVSQREQLDAGTLDAATLRWLSIALTHAGLVALDPGAAALSWDEAFTAGMAARASLHGDGDPHDPALPWRVGATDLHALLTLASGTSAALDVFVTDVKALLAGATVVDELRGDGTDLHGREHFGFAERAANPGFEGQYLDAHGRPRALTARRTARDRFEGVPGQRLAPLDALFTGRDAASPALQQHGSYLVARVLRQHVGALHRFVRAAADQLAVSPALVASRLLGRWPGGAPTVRADHDDPTLADVCAYSDFRYQRDAPPVRESAFANDCQPVAAPPAKADPAGARCPFSAHIRKTNPRDDAGEALGERLSFEDNRARVIVRRSVPYGAVSASRFDAPVDDGPLDDRGLMFLCYQGSIVRQFEFLQRGLVVADDAPVSGAGQDALLGQPRNGARRLSLGVLPDGRAVTATVTQRWVTTRGGGFFFAPSRSALAALAVAPAP